MGGLEYDAAPFWSAWRLAFAQTLVLPRADQPSCLRRAARGKCHCAFYSSQIVCSVCKDKKMRNRKELGHTAARSRECVAPSCLWAVC